jgi:hypothetical protein
VRYELWREDGDGTTYQLSAVGLVDQMGWDADEPDPVLVRTFEALSLADAKRQMHEYLGWEPYEPMVRPDGTPYPEDHLD